MSMTSVAIEAAGRAVRSLEDRFYRAKDGRIDHGAVLTEARELAAANRWSAVLDLTDVPEIAGRHDIIALRLYAAVELKRDDVILEIVDRACGPEGDDKIRLRLLSQLLSCHQPEQAWRIVQALGPDHAPKLLKSLSQIIQKTRDPEIRKAVDAFRRPFMGPSPIKLTVPRTPFPELPGLPHRHPVSRLRVIAEPDMAHHRDVFLEREQEFAARVERRSKPTARALKNVYVNPLGQIWTAAGELVSSRGMPIEMTPPPPPNAPRVVEGIHCIDETRNFYHWTIDNLGLLSCLAPDFPRHQVLLRSHPPSFQARSLQMLGWAPGDIISVEQPTFCETLHVAERSLPMLAQWSLTGGVYEALAAQAEAIVGPRKWPRRIFISRRDSQARVLDNEDALIELLKEFDITTVVMSEMTLAEQISLCRAVDMIVGLHGAGLAHLVMAYPGLRVLEIAPVFGHAYGLIHNMSRISYCRGHDHTLWLERFNAVSKRWTVDLDRLERFLEKWVPGDDD